MVGVAGHFPKLYMNFQAVARVTEKLVHSYIHTAGIATSVRRYHKNKDGMVLL